MNALLALAAGAATGYTAVRAYGFKWGAPVAIGLFLSAYVCGVWAA